MSDVVKFPTKSPRRIGGLSDEHIGVVEDAEDALGLADLESERLTKCADTARQPEFKRRFVAQAKDAEARRQRLEEIINGGPHE